jgi:hypothetical protein
MTSQYWQLKAVSVLNALRDLSVGRRSGEGAKAIF